MLFNHHSSQVYCGDRNFYALCVIKIANFYSQRIYMVIIALRLTSSIGVGYSVLQCKTGISFLDNPFATNTSKAAFISSKLAIPVDKITCFPFRAMCWRYGLLVISPEGILKNGEPNRSMKSMLYSSKPVDKNFILFLPAYDISLECQSLGISNCLSIAYCELSPSMIFLF